MNEVAPAWALGFDVAFLKEVAAVFKQHMKPHTYGAFGLPKERDIATAMQEQSLLFTRERAPDGGKKEGAPVEGAAIAKFLKRPSKHEDFCGRKAMVSGLFVKSIAGGPAALARLLESLKVQRGAAAMWVEGHVEDEALCRALEKEGLSLAMTKVSASSDLKGLWQIDAAISSLPEPLSRADEIGCKIIQEGFVTEAEQAACLEEAEAAAQWAQHYSSYNKGKSWTAFAIRGFAPQDPGFIIKPSEMSKQWKEENSEWLAAKCKDTIVADKFPTVQSIVARIPGEKERVRFMRLSAKGGELTRHADITDPDAGTRDGQLMRLHIPLRSDPRCIFHSWKLDGEESMLHFPERALCYLDTRKPHSVTNPADIERVHLVVDTFSTPDLREWLEEGAAF